MTCTDCEGRGSIGSDRCDTCHGSGTVIEASIQHHEDVLCEGRMAISNEELLPVEIDEQGRVGGSVFRRGRQSGIGRATRRAKEVAAEASERAIRALDSRAYAT